MNREQVRKLLVRTIDRDYGTQCAFAEAVGVSAVLVNHFVQGNRAVSGKVLKRLGLERVVSVSYRKST